MKNLYDSHYDKFFVALGTSLIPTRRYCFTSY